MNCYRILIASLVAWTSFSHAQTLQKGIDLSDTGTQSLRIDAIEYRAAKWEKKALKEAEIDRPNKGGLVHIYMTNVSDKPQGMRYFRLNGKDESYWLLGRFIAWHRTFDHSLEPGESTVLEINAVDKIFSEGKPLTVGLIGRNWMPAGHAKGVLKEDPARISSIVLDQSMDEIIFHVRYTGKRKIDFKSAQVLGHETETLEWVKGDNHAIGTLKLKTALAPSETLILRALIEENGKARYIHAHRRAHLSEFPIGVWNSKERNFERFKKLHIDTFVKGGRSDDSFYSEQRERYGFKTMVHNDKGRNVDQVRALGDDPGVLCWMLQDEPDWSVLPSVMLHADETTQRINKSVPTMITLCRTAKFFEYASIPDIPVHDHYSVGAPTSTVWPHRYGTHLEETGLYTRDLKEASEPKPIWVWTQGIADWDERPKRYSPTPNEIAAQLMLNIGRGAKGIIWFNWSDKAAEDYPESVEAYRDWGRVMRCIRPDLLKSDPIHLDFKGPDKLDVAPLVTHNTLILCITNTDYEIHPEAYPFTAKEDVQLEVELPAWLEDVQAYSITADGLLDHEITIVDGKAQLALGDIEAARMIVLTADESVRARHAAEHAQSIADESKTY